MNGNGCRRRSDLAVRKRHDRGHQHGFTHRNIPAKLRQQGFCMDQVGVGDGADRAALAASLGGQIKDDADVVATAPERAPKTGRRYNPPPFVDQS
jgi:hypothetical protein